MQNAPLDLQFFPLETAMYNRSFYCMLLAFIAIQALAMACIYRISTAKRYTPHNQQLTVPVGVVSTLNRPRYTDQEILDGQKNLGQLRPVIASEILTESEPPFRSRRRFYIRWER